MNQWAGIQQGDHLVWIGAPFHRIEELQGWRGIRHRVNVWLGREIPKFISVFDVSRKNVPYHLARITRSSDPYYIAGYTSTLVLMAQEIERQGLPIARRPRCVIATAETVSQTHRRLIERSFGSRAINQYASLEFGTVGFSCPDHPERMHFNAEWFVCEILLEDGRPAAVGETGHLVVTDLTNEVMPFIRYDTGDLVTVSGPCPCGRTWPAVAHVEGRTSDCFTTRSGRTIFSSVIDHFLQIQHDYTPYLVEYQTIRMSESEIQFIFVPTAGWTQKVERQLQHDLQSFFGEDFSVGLKAVSRIPREASGKRPLIKSMIPSDGDR